MAGYYDLILGLIPLALVGVSGFLVALGFGLTTAVPLSAVVAVGLIGHGLFVNGPVDEPTAPTASAQASFNSAD